MSFSVTPRLNPNAKTPCFWNTEVSLHLLMGVDGERRNLALDGQKQQQTMLENKERFLNFQQTNLITNNDRKEIYM
jgi:hypothetical protein